MSENEDRFRYRWFQALLAFGGMLAVLLFANSVFNYVWMTRRMGVEQARQEMRRQVVALERQMRQTGAVPLASRIQELAKNSDGRIAWVEVRDRKGQTLARSGLNPGPSFSPERIRSRLSNREPVMTVRRTGSGEAVVEMFPIRLGGAGGASFGMLEIAMPVGGDAVPWPVRRNLIINCSAALALLVALALIGLRFRAYLASRKLEQQLEIAREVQRSLLPGPGQVEHVELAAECLPASQVGGDFFDVFPAGDKATALVLGDVSGKGMPAALLMGVLHGAVRSGHWAGPAREHEAASRRLNRLLCERSAGPRFTSLFWSYYDADTKLLRYVNAGHWPPLLVTGRSGRTEVMRLEDGGPVMGLLPDADYSQGTVRLAPGDLLILYSDGLIEAANAAGEEFGEERLLRLAMGSGGKSCEEIRREVLDRLREFAGAAPFADDLTLVAARFEPAAISAEAAAELERTAA